MTTTHKEVKILMRAVFLAMGLLLMAVGTLSAAENLELRDTLEISGDVVLLGDLFDKLDHIADFTGRGDEPFETLAGLARAFDRLIGNGRRVLHPPLDFTDRGTEFFRR